MTQRTWDRIESARERWNVLRHPFYRRWSAGELSGEELARYSGQYRHAVKAIAEVSDAIAEGAPERPGLRRHAAEEREHVALWDGFLAAAGGSADDPATAETAECVRAWEEDHDLLGRLVTLYAIESGQPEIARVKREGLAEHYGIGDGDGNAYFRVHERLDVEHSEADRALIERHLQDADQDAMVEAAEAAFRANWRLLDGVA